MTLPVENTVCNGFLVALPLKSWRPDKIVTVYAMSGRQPLRFRMVIDVRCQSTLNGPSDGETITACSSPPPARGRSFTTSSKRKVTTCLGPTRSDPESGVTVSNTGGDLSSGPPGGAPCEAQPAAS